MSAWRETRELLVYRLAGRGRRGGRKVEGEGMRKGVEGEVEGE